MGLTMDFKKTTSVLGNYENTAGYQILRIVNRSALWRSLPSPPQGLLRRTTPYALVAPSSSKTNLIQISDLLHMYTLTNC